MAYNENLADRIRAKITAQTGLKEKKMFGGLSFLINGNMSVGVHGDEMIVRLAPDQTDSALSKPHTRLFNLTGRPIQGWILVKADALNQEELANWINIGVNFAASLPPKKL